MGVLILADTLGLPEIPVAIHTNFNIIDLRMSSTRAIVNLINFTLQTDGHGRDSSSSILLRDPYPEHVSNGLNRTAHSILYLFNLKLLTARMAETMASAVFTGLEILSQISYSAADAVPALLALYRDAKLTAMTRESQHSIQLPLISPLSPDTSVTLATFQNGTLIELDQQASADPSLVSKTIERHEAEIRTDFMLDSLLWTAFNSVSQDWAFEVSKCFANNIQAYF